ncbi:zf-HC2 domain-containing protein [Haemophilus haemolyticus]|uniref:Zf-HC2 domain-containing protein n=1 Tax=Haemophilus haemolyticus TaxID=726 RepID=A0A852Q2Q4_HAEHA|nr:zf-HC2 domain-containing protein [Haemophilus haemolyticus]NYA27629.1 zf-HC2 domain-containing protein [Haemophilus haemolyticus]
MRCIQATRIISDSHERSLELQEKMGLKIHLLTCPHCRRFQRNCKTLSMMMKKFKDSH